ncbi:MAG: hypothetical protein M3Q45_14875 [Chloroflexota bacterium]|nr:hypothetical protein [Chloroflexota bacterium]
MSKLFYAVVVNSLVASMTNTFVWFAITFWVYLQTKSVIATSVMAGVFTVTVAISGFLLGSLVDRYPKKTAMTISSVASLVLYAIACLIFVTTPPAVFTNASSATLWIFITFNNFLGGVFMSLMDAYGLSLVSVQVWGTFFGVLSLGFIVGGLVVARRGLGQNPLRTLFLSNIVTWTICIFFTIQASIVLLTIGMFVWLCLIPVVEAAEQTILQKVIPHERQGRVFGFAQSVEQAASPITAFMIGPIAQWIFIPFMTTGAGVNLIGGWFGTGSDRGLALLFTFAGLVGLIVTLLAMRSNAYKILSKQYQPSPTEEAPTLAAILLGEA